MKRYLFFLAAALLMMTVSADAAEIPKEWERALPRDALRVLDKVDPAETGALGSGITAIWNETASRLGDLVRERMRGTVCLLLVVLACGAVEGFAGACTDRSGLRLVPIVGALSITLLSAGSLHTLIGLGSETIAQLGSFAKLLFPVLAAATAASGAVTTATVQQVSTVLLSQLLIGLINGILLPMVYLYIAALTAGTMLPDHTLGSLAEFLKKALTWVLSIALTFFTLYLSAAHVISGTADAAKVKLTKAALSGVVPVVGGIIAEASETVLAGAGVLRSSVGLFGLLAVLALCAYPFLQLGVQYLFYKLAAALCGTVGSGDLGKLINGLGGAFGLVLGMTGACALLILISVLTCTAAVAV